MDYLGEIKPSGYKRRVIVSLGFVKIQERKETTGISPFRRGFRVTELPTV